MTTRLPYCNIYKAIRCLDISLNDAILGLESNLVSLINHNVYRYYDCTYKCNYLYVIHLLMIVYRYHIDYVLIMYWLCTDTEVIYYY